MFRSKHLYRAMMLSRSKSISRIDHLRKISLFELSFRTKVFKNSKRLRDSEKIQNQYPALNLLQNFKDAHFSYIKARLPISLLKSN